MNDYLRREIKFLIYIIVIFVVFLVVVPMLGGQKPAYTFDEILSDRRMLMFLVLIAGYSLVYPVIAFTTVKRYLNGSYNDNKEYFEKAFTETGFEKTVDSREKIVYRKTSRLTRFLQWGEDKVVIDPNANPVTISGLRKNVKRIDVIIDRYLASKN
jgi:hypothetical protein